MVYDCFQFFNELDILKLRMSILDPVVDRFVISEATTTFSGREKPLYYLENREMFAAFEHKIIHVTVDDTPKGGTHERDTFQKNAVGRGLKDCTDEDIIIFSDLDEIPDPVKVKEILDDFDKTKVYHFAQRLFYCYLNMEEVSGNLLAYGGEFPGIRDKKWIGTRMCSYRIARELECRLGELRFPEQKERGIRVDDGGWHFGYMGGHGERDIRKRVTEKVVSAAHDEYNNDKILSRAADNIMDGADLFDRQASFKRVDIDETFPVFLREHLDEYDHLIMREESSIAKNARHIKRMAVRSFDDVILALKRFVKKLMGRG